MKAITPLTKLLLSVKMDALLAFLNTMKVAWSLWREDDGSFHAEIEFEGETFVGSHSHIPTNALAHAAAKFLAEAKLDYHEYKE